MEVRTFYFHAINKTIMSKRLHRTEGKFLGVCAGVGEYFDLDPTVVRVAFLLGVFFAGLSVISYFILALVMPKG